MKHLIGWKPVVNNPRMGSARLRCFLPASYLHESGWRCEVFDPRNADKYRLVVFQKAYDDECLSLARKLTSRGVKTVFDICDNHFYNPGNDPVLEERADRLRRMIDAVSTVTVSTSELKKIVPANEATVIDDAIEWPRKNFAQDLYIRLKERVRTARSLRVIWYGNAGQENPPFGLIDLPKILPSLEELNLKVPIKLTIISNSRMIAKKYVRRTSFPITYKEWRSSTFASRFRQQDICVIPITLNPFTACKTNNRLVLSLLHGVPVVADRIPSYEEFKDFVLFSDWQSNLRRYAMDQRLSELHVTGGIKYIKSKYNKRRVVQQWTSLFQKVIG